MALNHNFVRNEWSDWHDWSRHFFSAEQFENIGDFHQATFSWFEALQETNDFNRYDRREFFCILLTLSRFARCCYIQGRFEMSETLFWQLNEFCRLHRSNLIAQSRSEICSSTSFSTASTELELLTLGGLALTNLRLNRPAQCQSYLESVVRSLERTDVSTSLLAVLHCLSAVLHRRLKADRAELSYIRAIEVARRLGIEGAQKLRFVAQDYDALSNGLMPTELALADLEAWILVSLQLHDFSVLHETFTTESRDLHT